MKECSVCKELKSFDCYYKNNQGKDGLYSKCKKCHLIGTKKWKVANPEKVNEEARLRRQKNPEARRQYERENYAKNSERIKERTRKIRSLDLKKYSKKTLDRIAKDPEKYRAIARKTYYKNIDKRRQDLRDYKNKNPEKMKIYELSRKYSKQAAMVGWSDDFLIAEIYHLAKLRNKMTNIKWHVDHIVPLRNKNVCGLHVHFNLRVIPALENLSKSNRYWPYMPD